MKPSNKLSGKSIVEIDAILVYEYLCFGTQKKLFGSRTREEKKIVLRLFSRLVNHVRGCSLLDADSELIQIFFNACSQEGASKATMNKYLNAIRPFYRYLNEVGYIPTNPAVDFRYLKILSTEPSRLTSHEIDLIMEELDSPNSRFSLKDATMAKIFYYTGITTTELSELRIGKINFEDKLIRVDTGLQTKWRTIPMAEQLNKQLIKYFESWPDGKTNPSTHVFPGRDGQKMNRSHIYERMSFILRHTDSKEKGANTFRNSFTHHLISGGEEITRVRGILGRKKLNIERLSQAWKFRGG